MWWFEVFHNRQKDKNRLCKHILTLSPQFSLITSMEKKMFVPELLRLSVASYMSILNHVSFVRMMMKMRKTKEKLLLTEQLKLKRRKRRRRRRPRSQEAR